MTINTRSSTMYDLTCVGPLPQWRFCRMIISLEICRSSETLGSSPPSPGSLSSVIEASLAGWRSGSRGIDRAVPDWGSEHEQFRGEIRVDVVGAHERHHPAAGQPLDLADRLVPHRLLELVAHCQHRFVIATIRENPLALRERVL